ncbi:MAG: hypothetical protein PHY34_03890 [Patescibacteria group bacterium]|nr:hypothetical protein [Patescibacteria group bacterium]
MTKRILVFSFIFTLLAPEIAAAATFNPNFIISDYDLTNTESMSATQVERFLKAKGSALTNYRTTDPWGEQKTAAQIIYDASRHWSINPQYLLVRMQIEQSLTLSTNPSQYQLDWATGYGVCDSCNVNDPQVIKYKGFFNQVNWAVRRIRESYIPDLITRGYTLSGWGPGITKTVTDYNGSYQVTPANNATAAMYTYTPHVYNGNYNIWKYWNDWFSKNYPDGTLLQVEGEHGVYIIENGKKRPFTSRTALVSRYDPSRIIIVSPSDIELYETGAPISFPNYSLVRSVDTGRVYLIDGEKRRYIESPEVFRKIGFNPEEMLDATEKDLRAYSRGENISMLSIYPTGVLLQSKETGGISYVENGIRHSIWSREILKSRFPNRVPVVVEQATIDEYPSGDPILFKDGELITSPSAQGVYVISNGKRRGIASKETFDSLGFKWENIYWTTDKALELHPIGDPVSTENY